MREALARSDIDFVATEEPRPARRRASRAKKQRFAWLRGSNIKPMRMLGLVVTAGVLVGIAINATMFQTARHPAPFFAEADKAAAQKPAIAPTPVPPPRPAEFAAQPSAKPLVTDPPRPAANIGRAQPEAAPAKKDPIAALLKADTSADPSPKTLAAQRALQKVGFVVKPDGVFGVTTRQAIEKFERDRNLPITGELAGRTLKELSAQSGIAIQ